MERMSFLKEAFMVYREEAWCEARNFCLEESKILLPIRFSGLTDSKCGQVASHYDLTAFKNVQNTRMRIHFKTGTDPEPRISLM